MKILKAANPNKAPILHGTCKNCGLELECALWEADDSGMYIEGYEHKTIHCPACTKTIVLEPALNLEERKRYLELVERTRSKDKESQSEV